jgi:hypothetical protein
LIGIEFSIISFGRGNFQSHLTTITFVACISLSPIDLEQSIKAGVEKNLVFSFEMEEENLY